MENHCQLCRLRSGPYCLTRTSSIVIAILSETMRFDSVAMKFLTQCTFHYNRYISPSIRILYIIDVYISIATRKNYDEKPSRENGILLFRAVQKEEVSSLPPAGSARRPPSHLCGPVPGPYGWGVENASLTGGCSGGIAEHPSLRK